MVGGEDREQLLGDATARLQAGTDGDVTEASGAAYLAYLRGQPAGVVAEQFVGVGGSHDPTLPRDVATASIRSRRLGSGRALAVA